jgi:hypothetical protein
MPNAFAIAPVQSTAFNLDLHIGGDGETRTEAIVNNGQRVILEDFLQTRAHDCARKILQQEAEKGLPFSPESGCRRVWRTTTVLFHPQPLALDTLPNIFIPQMQFPVGISIMQSRIKIDRAASYTFAVAVEDCISNAVTGATRRLGEAFTSQFPLLPKAIDPSDVLQNPRRAPKMYHPWALENVPGVGGHLKVYQPT